MSEWVYIERYDMEIKSTKKLGFRMTMYCIVFGTLLSLVIGGIGAYTYYVNSRSHFEYYLQAILDITKKTMDANAIKTTIQNSDFNDGYIEAQNQFNIIKDYTNIEYIYLLSPTVNGQYEYIICGYEEKEFEQPDEMVRFRDLLGDEVDQKMIREFDRVYAGEEDNNAVLNKSDLGYVMTFITSIENEKQEVIGVLAADILVDDIKEDLFDYILWVLLGTVVVLILFLCFFILTIKSKIIRPIILIGKHANEFVKQIEKKPSQMQIKEIKIRTRDELELLSKQLNSMMQDMITYMSGLESMTATQERMNVQLNVASQIQQSMLPNQFPAFPERKEFDIYALMKPSKEVGSEFYDFFMVDGTHLGVVIANVLGDGIPAALFMMRCKTLMKNYAVLGLEPAKIFCETNDELCENNDANMKVDAFLGVLDVYSGEFLYANAGIHRPYLLKADGKVREIEVEQAFSLGILERIPFYQEAMHMEKGDVLCLFTNGIFSMARGDGERMNVECLLSEKGMKDKSVMEAAEKIAREVEIFMGEEERTDITILVLEYIGDLMEIS